MAVASVCGTAPAVQAQTLWQPFSAMALEEGYRFTVVQTDGQLSMSWRPYDHGRLLETTQISLDGPRGALEARPGSAQALLEQVATVFVVLDPSDQDRLFDQLVALRAAFADARFDRQRWEVYVPRSAAVAVAIVNEEADLATQWPNLRALLSHQQTPPTAIAGALAPHLAALAQRSGDRKALIVPQSLMPALEPGLNARGIAALQAFGISLFPMTYQLSPEASSAFALLSGSTGGRVLPWLDIPPGSAEAAATFLPLSAGGMAVFDMPAPPWQPWKEPVPLIATLSGETGGVLSMIIPRRANAWGDLPWLVIGGLISVILGGAIFIFTFAARLNAKAPSAVLIDQSSGRSYPIRRWPTTVGRSDKAQITIANANLQPLHLQIKAVSGAAEMSLVNKDAGDLVIAGQSTHERVVALSTDFTLGGVPFRLTLSQAD